MEHRRLLEGKRALVTGASSGIGAAVARALGGAGASVIVNYRSGPEDAESIATEIRSAGVTALAIHADISDAAQCEQLFAQAAKALGGLDILVANAGIQRDAPFADMTLDDWRQVIDVNLTGQFLCAQQAVRLFDNNPVPDSGTARGNILFTNSVHQAIPWAGHVNYAASKGGLKLLMESLAQEVACRKIRVNGIAPGAIQTPINTEAWETEDARAELLKLIPYGRIGTPEDVAKAAVWLASDESDYVTGATLFVDGGMMLYPAFRGNG